MDNYHFYIDEGGLFGNCVVCLTTKKLKNSEIENHISNYYFGKLCIKNIINHLDMFNRLYPKYKIINHKKSEYIIDQKNLNTDF